MVATFGSSAAGDDAHALVLEVGTAQTRAGWAGDDAPRCCFGTAIGHVPLLGDQGDHMDTSHENGNGADGETADAGRKSSFIGKRTRRFWCGQQASTVSALHDGMEIANPLQGGQGAFVHMRMMCKCL